MREYIRLQIEWSARTFGPGRRTEAVSNHIRKELLEIERQPADMEEWIDVIILGIDGAWRTGFGKEPMPSEAIAEQIIETLERKQMKNFDRTFIIPTDPTQPAEHDRSLDAVVKEEETRG